MNEIKSELNVMSLQFEYLSIKSPNFVKTFAESERKTERMVKQTTEGCS